MKRTRGLGPWAAGAAVVVGVATGCPRSEPTRSGALPAGASAPATGQPPRAAPVAAPVQASTSIPAPPEVVRAPVAPLPLETKVERGTKPAESADLEKKGLGLFAANCQTCHGAKGQGDGPAAAFVQPHPRNFTKGLFKVHSNESGQLPTDEDLFDTISRGMPGSAMPSFAALSSEDRWALVAAVKSLAVFKDEDEGVEIHFFKERPAGPPIDIGQPVAASPAAVEKGHGAFLKLDCNKCHGPQGDGSGPSSTDLKDDWGEVIWPRNFQQGRFRGVTSIRDIATRLTVGLPGTPMAAFGGGQLTNEERWEVGHFIASLRKGEPVAQPVKDGVLVASKSAAPLPSDLRQPRFWMDVPVYEVALDGNGPKKARVAVQRDATKIEVLVAWDDPITKEHPAAIEDFLDGAALELSSTEAQNAWEWKGEWQQNAASRPTGAFEERGVQSGKIEGNACWSEGEWRVLFVRPLAGDGGRIPLEGRSVDLKLTITDRSPAGTKTSKSGSLKIATP